MICKACEGCGGEDCVCCEIFLEEQRDQRSYYEEMGDEDFYQMLDFLEFCDFEEEDEDYEI